MSQLRNILLVLIIGLLPIILHSPPGELTCEQIFYRLRLVEEIKVFEKELGFNETDNFKTYSDLKAYDYFFYTPNTRLPYSLDDPMLQCAEGKPENFDLEGFDVYYYAIPAIAGVETPLTKSLLRAPLPRFIQVVFHEDWHEQIDSTGGIEEPCAEIVGYVAALLFTEEKFGKASPVYKILEESFDNNLKESRLYKQYYEELNALYSALHSGEISEEETYAKKAELFQSMGNDLQDIWGSRPTQLNNAFIAFLMTYKRHLPLIYQYSANFDLQETMAIFRAIPNQGAEFTSVEEVKDIENEVISILAKNLDPLGQ